MYENLVTKNLMVRVIKMESCWEEKKVEKRQNIASIIVLM